ncbi:MAG: hypothetical protein ACPGXK_01500 [Phycisphaerae bacterium]
MVTKNWIKRSFLAAVAACLVIPNLAQAQVILWEDFDSATGTGGLDILIGGGFNEVDGFDDGIEGESAFVGTWGDGMIGTSSVNGFPTGGVNNSGRAELLIDQATYDVGGWFGAVLWRDLSLPTFDDSRINMRASVRGDVFQAPYLFRLEAQKSVPFGLDESFGDASFEGGGMFLAPGGVNGFTPNWDTGISGESAFAGVFGSAQVFGGITANAIESGGFDGAAGELVVDAISFGPGSGWFAGLAWGDQELPTEVLEDVTLSARIRGTAQGNLGETLGKYALRIEDANQDWRSFPATANGSYQQIGGTLAEGIEGGFDDGIFDPTAGPFTVVLVFDNDVQNTWGFGGKLTIDDLFLTGGFTTEVVGEVVFDGTSPNTLTYGAIGGRLDSGDSSFANIEEDFAAANGSGGGEFFNNTSGGTGFTAGYDDGLDGEAAFAGFWGGVSVGSVTANATLNGGVDNSRAVELMATDMVVNSVGGWWAGLMWQEQVLPEKPLDEIFLTADIKGVTVPGSSLGEYHLRIEDAQGDYLGFVTQANGSFQSVGGPLSDAVEGTFIGDGTFDIDSGPFTVVVAFFLETDTWGTGGKLTVDNLFMTPADFGTGSDTFAGVIAFKDEVAEWGDGGVLDIDDVAIVVVNTDADGDEDVDLKDFGMVQNCYSSGSEYESNHCLGLDQDGDFDLDGSDYEIFAGDLAGPQ